MIYMKTIQLNYFTGETIPFSKSELTGIVPNF